MLTGATGGGGGTTLRFSVTLCPSFITRSYMPTCPAFSGITDLGSGWRFHWIELFQERECEMVFRVIIHKKGLGYDRSHSLQSSFVERIRASGNGVRCVTNLSSHLDDTTTALRESTRSILELLSPPKACNFQGKLLWVVQVTETGCRMVVARCWGQGLMRTNCLIDTEFQFYEVKSSEDRWWQWWYNIMSEMRW